MADQMIDGKTEKAPGDELDYAVDWLANGTLETGETIVTSTWTVPTGLTRGESFGSPKPATNTDTVATVWIGGGTLGYQYTVSNTITTSAGREYVRTFDLYINTL